MEESSSKKREQSLRDLYLGETEEWYGKADENLKRYVAALARIAERLSVEEKILTNSQRSSTLEEALQNKRSKGNAV